MNRKIYTILLTVLSFSFLHGQNLQITNAPPYNTAANLINDVFSDGSVTITNVTTFADPSQYGFFYDGMAAVGMDSGVVMATNSLSSITTSQSAPTGSSTHLTSTNGTFFGFPWMGNSNNNNLMQVSASVPGLIGESFSTPANINSACAISFDFVPQDDTMRFKFAFASDEWDSWPCSQYNDVFGFFVAGPGINGPYNAPPGFSNADNFALVPGTNIPITISSITSAFNFGSCSQSHNSQHYVNANSNGLTLNARTDTLEVIFPVQACETYNFTMAIANGQDASLQSAVFMEGNSFGTKEALDISIEPGYQFGGDSIVYEGCDSMRVFMSRNDTASSQDSVFMKVFGGGASRVGFNNPIDTLVFAPNQDTISFSFAAMLDSINQGIDTLYIVIDSSSIDLGCSVFESDTLMFIIDDAIPFQYEISHDTVMCTDPPVNVNVNITDGMPPYSYEWENNNTNNSFAVPAPESDTAIGVMVYDACHIDTLYDSARITVQNAPTSISAGSDTIDCESSGTTVFVDVFNAMPDLQYAWSNSETNSGFFENNPLISTDYIVTVTQECAGYEFIDTFNLVVDNPPFTVELQDTSIDCTDPAFEIGPDVSYTTPGFTYEWNTSEVDSSITINPINSAYFSVDVTDACGRRTETAQMFVEVLANPMTLTGDAPTVECIGDTIDMEVFVEGGYRPYSYEWSSGGTDSVETAGISEPDTFAVSVTDQCALDTVTRLFPVQLQQYPDVTFDNIDNDSLLCAGDQYRLGPAVIFGGSGDFELSWNNWQDQLNLAYGITDTSKSYTLRVHDLCTRDTVDTNVHVFVPEYEALLLSTTNDTLICPGDQLILNAEAEGGVESHPYRFLWSNGSDEQQTRVQNQNSRSFTVTVTDACGTTSTGEIFVERSLPEAEFDFEFLDGFNVIFENESRRAASYLWHFGDGDTSNLENPLHTYEKDKTHFVMLEAFNEAGCRDTISKELNPPMEVFIPNAFTPNNDGLNDYFEIEGWGINDSRAVLKFEVRIFNRWGEQLFRSNDPGFRWDGTNENGTACPNGVYVYKITIEGYARQKIERKGTITIVSSGQ